MLSRLENPTAAATRHRTLLLALMFLPFSARIGSAQDVAADGLVQARSNDERVVTRVYTVKRLLQRTCDSTQCTVVQAMGKVQSRLFGAAGDDGGNPMLKFEWFGDDLVVQQSVAAHRRTAERLKTLRRKGFEQESGTSDSSTMHRHSVSEPLTRGPKLQSLPAPTDEQVLSLLREKGPKGLPALRETQRDNVRIIKEKIADYVDPPSVYPRIGKAQRHHAHYQCTIHCNKTTRVGWPVPSTTTEQDATEVLYIDHHHLHVFSDETDRPVADAKAELPPPYPLNDDVQYFAESDRTDKGEGAILPSPYYLQDDIQYFPAGPEFKLQNESKNQP